MPAFCSALGTVILTAVVILCIPLTVPRFLGYDIYTVISGSMEPAIPVGSLVYVKEAEPETIREDDVIAFYGTGASDAVITHRVVSNSVVTGEFITKGDANQSNDMNPIPYDNFIGKVQLTVPAAGTAAELFTGFWGKIFAAGMIAAAVMLHAAAHLMKK